MQPLGVVSIKPLGKTTEAEKELVSAAIPELKTNIDKVCVTLKNLKC